MCVAWCCPDPNSRYIDRRLSDVSNPGVLGFRGKYIPSPAFDKVTRWLRRLVSLIRKLLHCDGSPSQNLPRCLCLKYKRAYDIRPTDQTNHLCYHKCHLTLIVRHCANNRYVTTRKNEFCINSRQNIVGLSKEDMIWNAKLEPTTWTGFHQNQPLAPREVLTNN